MAAVVCGEANRDEFVEKRPGEAGLSEERGESDKGGMMGEVTR